MATLNKYVDTDVVGGDGDGSSWANAYSTLNAAEAGLQMDLDAANDIMIIWCRASSGTADTISTRINGWVTSTNDYIQIEAADGDQATKTGLDIARYRLDVVAAHCLHLSDGHIKLVGLQILPDSTGGTSYAVYVQEVPAGWTYIDSCRLTGMAGSDRGIVAFDSDANVIVWNTIIENMGSRGAFCDNSADLKLYNSVIYNTPNDGVEYQTGTTGTIKNCAIFKNGDDFDIDGGATVTIDYCASDDGDGTNDVAESSGGVEWPSDFNDAANGDFTLLVGSNLKGAGVNDPGGGLYSTDMEGDNYVVDSWSLGADEYVAAGGLSIPVAMKHLRNQKIA